MAKEKFNTEIRNELVKAMREMIDSEKGLTLGFALAVYHKWQTSYDQEQMPEEERMTDEQEDMLFRICLCLGDQIDNMQNNLNELLSHKGEKGVASDFYLHMVGNILYLFNISEKTEDADEGELWIETDNRNIHRYIVSFVGLCVRCLHDDITTAAEIADIMAEDDVTDPWHSCTDHRATYRYVNDAYGLESNDCTQFYENFDAVSNDPEYTREKSEEIMKDIAEYMPKVLSMFCGTTLSGCETEEAQKAFHKRLDEMMADDKHREQMKMYYTMGVVFIGMCTSGVDLLEKLHTHDACVEMFNVWYECFAGEPLKVYYETLTDEEKNVIRVTFLGGLLFSITKNSLSDNGDFISQGCMFKPLHEQ